MAEVKTPFTGEYTANGTDYTFFAQFSVQIHSIRMGYLHRSRMAGALKMTLYPLNPDLPSTSLSTSHLTPIVSSSVSGRPAESASLLHYFINMIVGMTPLTCMHGCLPSS